MTKTPHKRIALQSAQAKDSRDARADDHLAVGHDIDDVRGATRSSEVTALVTRRALALYDVFFAS